MQYKHSPTIVWIQMFLEMHVVTLTTKSQQSYTAIAV